MVDLKLTTSSRFYMETQLLKKKKKRQILFKLLYLLKFKGNQKYLRENSQVSQKKKLLIQRFSGKKKLAYTCN